MTVKIYFFSFILDFYGEDENNKSKTKRMRIDENVEAQQEVKEDKKVKFPFLQQLPQLHCKLQVI